MTQIGPSPSSWYNSENEEIRLDVDHGIAGFSVSFLKGNKPCDPMDYDPLRSLSLNTMTTARNSRNCQIFLTEIMAYPFSAVTFWPNDTDPGKMLKVSKHHYSSYEHLARAYRNTNEAGLKLKVKVI